MSSRLSNLDNRLVSLDVFRGLTIALMILVNSPGSWAHVYPSLLHASWHGIHAADLVFPFFLFIIGVSMSFSLGKKETGLNASMAGKIAKRVLIIFSIGLLLNYFPFFNKELANLRIMSVLQRIALAYGLAAFLCVSIQKSMLWKVGLALLLAYWGLIYWLGEPSPYSLEGNATTAVDLWVFGENHLYKGFGIPFDPEGLMGTISASVSIIFGYLVGMKIEETLDRNILVKKLLFLGILAVAIGLLWNIAFPINKPIWSSSYVVFTTGIACICLAFLIGIIDIKGYQKWTKPFLIFGLNPMILYVISILLVKISIYVVRWESSKSPKTNTLYEWLYQSAFVSLSPNNLELASLMFAASTVLICWIVGATLYNRKIIIKI